MALTTHVFFNFTTLYKAFLNSKGSVQAAHRQDPSTIKSIFHQYKIPRSGDPETTLEAYLLKLKTTVIEPSTHVSAPNMIGHMTTAIPYFHRPLARLLTALNQNVVKLETSASMTYLERETIAMMHKEFYQYKNTFYNLYMHSFNHALGIFTSGMQLF